MFEDSLETIDLRVIVENKEDFKHPDWMKRAKIVLIPIFLLCMFASLVTPFLTFGGKIQLMNVVSNSMSPTFEKGDLVAVSRDYNELNVGDIIVYRQPDDQKTLITHRVVQIDPVRVTTKGDNNATSDTPIDRKQVYGEVSGIFPNFGWFMNPKVIIPVGLLSIILIMCVDYLESRKHKKLEEENNNTNKENTNTTRNKNNVMFTRENNVENLNTIEKETSSNSDEADREYKRRYEDLQLEMAEMTKYFTKLLETLNTVNTRTEKLRTVESNIGGSNGNNAGESPTINVYVNDLKDEKLEEYGLQDIENVVKWVVSAENNMKQNLQQESKEKLFSDTKKFSGRIDYLPERKPAPAVARRAAVLESDETECNCSNIFEQQDEEFLSYTGKRFSGGRNDSHGDNVGNAAPKRSTADTEPSRSAPKRSISDSNGSMSVPKRSLLVASEVEENFPKRSAGRRFAELTEDAGISPRRAAGRRMENSSPAPEQTPRRGLQENSPRRSLNIDHNSLDNTVGFVPVKPRRAMF